jgi:hypothetical protein
MGTGSQRPCRERKQMTLSCHRRPRLSPVPSLLPSGPAAACGPSGSCSSLVAPASLIFLLSLCRPHWACLCSASRCPARRAPRPPWRQSCLRSGYLSPISLPSAPVMDSRPGVSSGRWGRRGPTASTTASASVLNHRPHASPMLRVQGLLGPVLRRAKIKVHTKR